MKELLPSVYLIAETALGNVSTALEALGAPDWETDAQSDAEHLTEFAGKLCYMSFDKSLNENLTATGTKTNAEYIAKSIISNQHGSVLEHSTASIVIADVSRVVTHEIVRHRAGTAFSQVSGRYVRTHEFTAMIPQAIKRQSPEVQAKFWAALTESERRYQDLIDSIDWSALSFAEKKKLTSACRRVLPEGRGNHILVTANHRAWRHMIRLRTDEAAEEEIQYVFGKIYEVLKANYPSIYRTLDPA